MFRSGLRVARANTAAFCTTAAGAAAPLKTVVVLGSARKKRIGTKVAQTVIATLEAGQSPLATEVLREDTGDCVVLP